MTPTDKNLFSLIMDLATVLIPDPRIHHSMRSQAAARLRKAREDGWEGFDAAARRLGASLEPVWAPQGYVGAGDVVQPSTTVSRPAVQGQPGQELYGSTFTATPSGVEYGEWLPGDGDFIPSIRIPERY